VGGTKSKLESGNAKEAGGSNMNRQRQWLAVAAMALLAVGMAPRAAALENRWKGTETSTAWETAGNWSLNAVPDSTHDVIIDGNSIGTGMPTLNFTASGSPAVTIQSLTLGTNTTSTLTLSNGNVTDKKLIVTGNVTIGGSGTLTHTANPSGDTEQHKLFLDVGGSLSISNGGTITASGRGFLSGGPGRPTAGTSYNRGGSGHGGEGGSGGSTYGFGGAAYGSVTNPVTYGSGNAAAGGGVVLVRVAGAVVLEGAISAGGVDAIASGAGTGGGAGGSINITAGSLAGSGTMTAAGGLGHEGWNESGGGGGRIAVVLTNGTFGAFPVTNITALGGAITYSANRSSGAAGTVYLKDINQTYGALVVRNFANAYFTASQTPMSNGTYRFDSIVVTNRGTLAVGTNATLDLTGCVLSGDDNTGAVGANIGGRIVFGLPGSTVTWPDPFTNTVTLSQAGTNLQTLAADVTVAAGGMFSHELNAGSEENKLNLKVNGVLTVNNGGAINVSGCGYGPGYGPGKPAAGTYPRGGAGHGGEGGRGYSLTAAGGTTYGSVTNPANLGSGSALYRGGGAALVQVTGALTNNGTIAAMGQASPGGNNTGAGAGGTINIRAATLSGNGTITAQGGAGNDSWDQGGGGGGRIAVILTGGDFSAFPAANITAVGGAAAGSGQEPGAAGMVYLRAGGQAHGGLTIANGNLTTAARTRIWTNVTDTVVGAVALKDKAQLTVETDVTLTVYGNWSNGTVNAVSGGGTVQFAGATTNTVHGNTTFDHVICQTPGKTLQFEAGKTQTVLAGLTIAGVSNNPVALLPATAGQQWFIKVTNSISAPPISYVVVSNSTAVTSAGGQALTASFSTPEYVGGVDNTLNSNTNWSFSLSAQARVWNGSESTSWGDENNWTPSGVPQDTDLSITIPAAPGNQPTLDVVPPAFSFPLIVESGAVLTLGNNLTVGALTNAGTIIATGSETLTCLNDVDFTDGSFTAAQSTLRLAGSGLQTLTANGVTFYALDIANTNAVTVSDAFTARDLTFPSSSANVAFNDGFTATNVSVAVTNGATLSFTAGQAYTVRNGLVLSGAAGKPILMNDAGGSWTLNVGGYAAVRYVSADHSDARGGRKIYAVSSTDGGNNQNWDFGAGKLWAGTTTSWTNDANWLPSGAPVSTNVVLIDGSAAAGVRLTNATTIAGLIVAGASGAATLTVDMPSVDAALTVTGDLDVGANGTLTHTANPAGADELYRLVLNVSNNLTIASGGKMDVSLCGYANGYGPGTSPWAGGYCRGGAGHGGQGGRGYIWTSPGGTTYGSVINPANLGSGSALYRGGGAVIVRVAGAMTHNGAIAAVGQAAPGGSNTGAGSGGTINISAATLSGSGSMSVRGGAGADGWDCGGGGGGRIAVILSSGDFTAFPVTNITALGGAITTYSGEEPGAAGTIYLQTAAQGGGKGAVTINNANQTTAARTHIPPAVSPVLDELCYASVIVTNRGALAVTTNDRIASLTVVNTTEPLNLGASNTVLTVMTSEMSINGTAYTKAGLYTTNNWNGFDSPGVNVTGAGAILLYRPSGTVIMIR
jgi:hypothetical protein